MIVSKFIFTLLIFGLYCSLIACSTSATSLQELSKELFSEYPYEVDTDRNKSSTQLIVIKINKENFRLMIMIKLKQTIKQEVGFC